MEWSYYIRLHCVYSWNLVRIISSKSVRGCGKCYFKPESIPIGCVPPASVAISGVFTPRSLTPVHTHPVHTVQVHARILTPLPKCMLGYTPCGQIHTCENITFPKLRLRALTRERRENVERAGKTRNFILIGVWQTWTNYQDIAMTG